MKRAAGNRDADDGGDANEDDAGGKKRRASRQDKEKASASPSSSSRSKKRQEEKREARYIASPSQPVRERIERAFQHRLYLIDKKPVSDLSCHFFVLGATGNVYTVKLEKQPSCSCPDFGRCHTCKHVLFVMLRVLKLPQTDPRVWQKALLSSELQDLLHISAVNDEAVLASQSVRQRFQQISNKTSTSGDGDSNDKAEKTVQRPVEGDCPICYEPMAAEDGSPVEALVFCRTCGNNVHRDCFQRWSQSKSSAAKVTCIYCRAVWNAASKSETTRDSGYVNLASYSEHHKPADTSLEARYPDSHSWIRRSSRTLHEHEEDEDLY